MDEIDIWRTAKLLIDQRGKSAAHDALARAGDMKAAGDEEGSAVWLRIFDAIEELQREIRNKSEPVH